MRSTDTMRSRTKLLAGILVIVVLALGYVLLQRKPAEAKGDDSKALVATSVPPIEPSATAPEASPRASAVLGSTPEVASTPASAASTTPIGLPAEAAQANATPVRMMPEPPARPPNATPTSGGTGAVVPSGVVVTNEAKIPVPEQGPIDEVKATRQMVAAHEPLRKPEVANPDSTPNREILQTMVTKALARAKADQAKDAAKTATP